MTPAALLLISSHCPHCGSVLAGLTELLKRGLVGRLEVVNLEVHPEEAEKRGVRSVPWLRLGVFELPGDRTPAELEAWARRSLDAEGLADGFRELLRSGELRQVLRLVADEPGRLSALLPILGDPEAAMNLRLGAAAVFENQAGSASLLALVPELGELSRHPDARVRADACHVLSLAGGAMVRPWLEARLADEHGEVREIAREGLDQNPG